MRNTHHRVHQLQQFVVIPRALYAHCVNIVKGTMGAWAMFATYIWGARINAVIVAANGGE